MLTEIAKLDAVRAAGLPDAAKASSQRPQATLVTEPKIAAPCEDDRAIQQNARSGSAGTVSQPTQEWRQIGGSRMMAAVRDRHAARTRVPEGERSNGRFGVASGEAYKARGKMQII